jgi:hypothetical protein
MRRLATVLAALAVAAVLVTGCGPTRWSPAPQAPSLPPAFGARDVDGQLALSTGSKCLGVTELSLMFDYGSKLVLRSTDPRGVDVDRLTLGGPYPGMQIAQELPAGFDWRSADLLMLSVTARTGAFAATSELPPVVKDSAAHPADTYYFQRIGWLNAADVAAQDGKTFLATCTPDPKGK